MRKGYIQLYTGNGKGKTTAALGLALRALGANLKICIIQFCKTCDTSEYKILSDFLGVDIYAFGRKGFISKKTKKDFEIIAAAWRLTEQIIYSQKYDVLILDELNIAIYHKLLNILKVIDVLKNRPNNLEIVITGRYADKKIIEISDIVTEMREIKHYYKSANIKARKGIEK
ncbi:MAG TPA: cob(I)yrinic acid a,c-diamide adenosyltransferase [bacterium]|nr:cob(I)yrinic acid a,c-diamide adenosyltransferase [bacterium]